MIAVSLDTQDPNREPRRLTWLYVAALSAVALLSLAGQLVIQNFLGRQASDSTVINIAGRQRMLSQRLTKAALALGESDDTDERQARLDELRDSLALWQKCHRGLQTGDASLGLPGHNSPFVAQQFAALEPHFQGLQSAAQQLLDEPATTTQASELLRHERPFLAGMDAIVSQYELEAREHVGTLQAVERALFALTIVVLVLEGILVFRPAVRHIQSTLAALRTAGEELRQAKETAEAASQAKSRLLANTSHELRTPLHAILGVTERLAVGPLSADQVRDVAVVRSSAITLLQLVSDLLDVAAIEAGKLQLRLETVPLRRLVEDTAAILWASATDQRVDVAAEIAPDVPEQVATDGLRLEQVLLNLGGNAIKYTERGSVTLRVSVVRRVHQHVLLRLAVIDTGIGISPSERQRVFEAFTRVNDDVAPRGRGGVGLGLAICQHVIQLLGGELQLQSEPGRGSEFSFTLPVETVDTPVSPEAEEPAHLPRFDGRRVLVVDDGPVNRELATSVLAGAGCETVAAEDGQQALKALEHSWFDAVLLDLRLPGLSGGDLAEAMRQLAVIKGRSPMPIIALTADGRAGEISNHGLFHTVLLKPAGRREILSALTGVLSPGSNRAALTRLRGDASLLAELQSLFAEEVPRLLAEIERGLRDENRELVRRSAHQLRGQALQLEAHELVYLAAQLESISAESSRDALDALVRQLADAANKILEDPHRYVESGSRTPGL